MSTLRFRVVEKAFQAKFDGNMWIGQTSAFQGLDKYRLNYDLINPKDKKTLANKGDRMNAKRLSRVMSASAEFGIVSDSLLGEYLFEPITDGEGNVLYRAGTEITNDVLADIEKLNVREISLIAIDNTTVSAHMRNTLIADKMSNREEALIEIYNIIRPGERPTLEAAINLFMRQGFDPAYYDLSVTQERLRKEAA